MWVKEMFKSELQLPISSTKTFCTVYLFFLYRSNAPSFDKVIAASTLIFLAAASVYNS